VTQTVERSGRWTRSERARLSGILGVIALLHVAGLSLYLAHRGDAAAAGGLAGSGALAYVLGMRHAFDADHIAAIDDTTRVMLMRGRRPVGVGFFFAMGHSTVVIVLALLVAAAAGRITQAQVDSMRSAGGTIAVVVAMVFLLLVATLCVLVRPFARGALAALAALTKFAPVLLAPMLMTYRPPAGADSHRHRQ
jgi:high-affinity nickel-transport protein